MQGKLLFLEWKSFGNEYIKKEFENAGYAIVSMEFPQQTENTRRSEELATKIAMLIMQEKVDFVFSFNFFPVAAVACKACRVKYLSWTYDSPYIQLYSRTILYETNYAFVFDKAEYENLRKKGVNTVYYLPMAAPVEYYDGFVNGPEQEKKYRADVAMIGSMYSEKKHQLFRHLDGLDPYASGYIEAVMEVQKKLYGISVLEKMLHGDIVRRLQAVCPMMENGDGLENIEWVFANYFLARKLTALERRDLLEQLSKEFAVTLYTPEETPNLPLVDNRGKIDYYDAAPYAIKGAKINLNISLRSIVSGIPLRCWDIMGCGGFLLTNYQNDFLDFFVPGEDYVYFDSPEDLLEKTRYYLENENERQEIAARGYRKVKEHHTYRHRVEEMLRIAFGA